MEQPPMHARTLGRSGFLTAAATIAALVTVLALSTSSAFATDGPDWPNWTKLRPASLEAGGDPGWYMWTDADGIHIRTTTPSDAGHPFRAVIRAEPGSQFADVHKVRL